MSAAISPQPRTIPQAERAAPIDQFSTPSMNVSEPVQSKNLTRGEAVIVARQVIDEEGADVEVGASPDAFPVVSEEAEANATLLKIRQGIGPDAYLCWARRWVEQGASIGGGSRGIGPEHIARLDGDLLPGANATLSQGNG
ncbi:hypothetical protein ABQX22_05375 [Xanthomonas sp. WHRI 1810A]|uniref:hypothetical protein n=1 Tax=Xanthomonas sp. WHRI 1810A TaxID=3161565 RepID=UPI0032E85747